ncbi:MAG: oligosaccharide flippase family protein [Proteobacteria bacterium]|nr:oligosaccharide flippase family protein [Pseudomonadota bacterium]
MNTSEKDPVLKSIAQYSSGNIFRRALGLAYAILKPKLLTPELYGVWNLLSLIPNYALFSDLGARQAMRFDVPYHEARQETEKSQAVQSSAFYGTFYLIAVFALVLILIALVIKTSWVIRAGLAAMALAVLIEWYYEYRTTVLKGYQDFRTVTRSMYIRATSAVVLGIVLIYLFSIYGAFASVIISNLIAALYVRLQLPNRPKGPELWPTFLRLVRKGFPIMLFGLLILLIRSTDRFIIALYLTKRELGYYGIAIMFFGFLMQIPGSAREVMEPRLMEDLSRGDEDDSLREYFFKPLINTAFYIPFLIGGVVFITPVFVRFVLPRYSPGVPSTQILALGGYYLALAYIARGILVAKNLQMKAVGLLALSVVLNVGLSVLLVRLGYGIEGVAAGSSLSFLSFFALNYIFIRWHSPYALEDWKRCTEAMVWPFLLMCVLILLLRRAARAAPLPEPAADLASLVVFYVLMYLAAHLAARRYHLLSRIGFLHLWSRAIRRKD